MRNDYLLRLSTLFIGLLLVNATHAAPPSSSASAPVLMKPQQIGVTPNVTTPPIRPDLNAKPLPHGINAQPNLSGNIIKHLPSCIDPAVQSLTYQIISRDRSGYSGRIRLTGVIKNVGNAAFDSNPRQASVWLSKQYGTSGSILTQLPIRHLDVNGTMSVTSDMDWNFDLEFPPNFVLMISYDPDIYLDANKNNDDCHQNNNQMELAGERINRESTR